MLYILVLKLRLMGMQNNDFHNGISMCVYHCTVLIFAAHPPLLSTLSFDLGLIWNEWILAHLCMGAFAFCKAFFRGQRYDSAG